MDPGPKTRDSPGPPGPHRAFREDSLGSWRCGEKGVASTGKACPCPMQRGVPILLVTLSPCSEADAHPLRDRSLDFQGPAHMDAHPPSWACLDAERPVSMSFPLSSPRFSSSAFSSVFHSINPSAFKKQKKVSSALTEVRPVGLPAGALKGSGSSSGGVSPLAWMDLALQDKEDS